MVGGFLSRKAAILGAVSGQAGLVGGGAGIRILPAGHKVQLDSIRLRGLGHAAVSGSGLGLQLFAGGVIGHCKLRRRLFFQREVGVHHHEPVVGCVEHIGAVVVVPCREGHRPRDQGVGLGQQPEDAGGHQRHGSAACGQKKHPVPRQPQTLADLPLPVGHPPGGRSFLHISLPHLFGSFSIAAVQPVQDTPYL